MPTLYERYQSGDDANQSIYGADWNAQTFVPSVAHYINSVKIYCHKIGSPTGLLVAGIRATSGGLPSGSDLVTGNVSASTVGGTNSWIEISATPYLLSASTEYAMAIRVPSGDGLNYINWRVQSDLNGYPIGDACYSSNSGSTWAFLGEDGWDFLFEDWGNPTAFIPKVVIM